ncbi:type IV secretory system conjugative DNA transfer family protein [Streptococcus chenjunshii]|uniref:Type IV secretory system conjugative DNA transfer family protein n=1 Tax=Streptococcus chenjunshii TaxID=2173853 RepID=A0A372KPF8_9STRE|nr:type IV secretory system conjugative DNA transfer family protein [Streptococcus chenjunshii]AXQ78576.1 type IV secretory system conjugative DNA transfer family protein [Streptococcus chenjunshii]RFU51960.1 type IV secretory system conjugative DNA transfer family protein [Streptococcus chenjunshii]RFU54152.1 type IV secretory system conjugative DNA transfer family protein [Streptococcus chenjunshii]
MFSWLEAIFYTLIHLSKVSHFNAILLVSFVGYLCYQGIKAVKGPMQNFFQTMKGFIDDRDSTKEYLKNKRKELAYFWQHRHEIDWKSAGKEKSKELWQLIKRFATIIPSFLFLLLGNLFFRLTYKLPFIKQDRKRFNKEMKPLLYFKNYRSFVFMGLGFSFIAFILTNYLVTVLRAAIRFCYFSVIALRDNSQAVTFNVDSLLIRNLFNARVFVIAPILTVPIFLIGLVVAWRSAWVNFEQFRDYNYNEEGDDRFATVKEIHQQYKKVPNKTETYPGEGGVPVLHETRRNLAGLTLGSQMLWQNRTFSRYMTNAERVLGIYAKASGDYYIDNSTTNVLGIGMTRSGKGEGHITPTIDINSRAKIQPSMVIADPKGEHYQSSYKTMRQRGYDVNVLSFQNMDWSMSYNPLALAIAAAKKGYYEMTQTRVNAVAEAIYRKTKPGTGKGNAKYFEDTSIALFNAIAMALIDRANETFQNGENDAWDTVTVRNIAKFLTDLGSEEVFVDDLGEIIENPNRDQAVKKKSKITVYFDNLRTINQRQFSKFREMADLNFRSSDFAAEETKGNVYSSMMAGVNLFLQDNIAKLTSSNSIDLESVGFPRRLSIKFRSSSNAAMRNEYAHKTAKVTITSQSAWGKTTRQVTHINAATTLIDGEGYLTYAIEPKLPEQFLVTVDFDHKNNGDSSIRKKTFQFSAEKVYKRRGKIIALDEYTKKPVLDYIKVTVLNKQEGSLLQEEDIDLIYSDNPKVIYLVTPPNRTEYNSIVSLFLDQLFNANYELALSNGRKCINRILHILDEFANITAIPNMDTKISIGLAQNILYYLWIQNLKQLTDKYGENTAQTIRENCSLQIYVKSAGDTNTAFSKELGTRTITRRRRSSNILDEANPNVTIENPRQELLTPTQLSKLQEGEAVILRWVKGRDNAGRKVTLDPIFLHEKTSLPYRYMFLQEEFDHSMTLADIPVESGHRDLDLQDIAVGAQSTFSKIIDWRIALTDRMRTNGEPPQLATRKQQSKPLTQAQFTSPADLTQAVIAEVFEEEDDGDIFFVDDVI